ncbi:MAG: hypothetical protein HQL53_10105 [Magnetococcales bacterium]|nr:hypothetical protein [Magnetococcales bacterium]
MKRLISILFMFSLLMSGRAAAGSWAALTTAAPSASQGDWVNLNDRIESEVNDVGSKGWFNLGALTESRARGRFEQEVNGWIGLAGLEVDRQQARYAAKSGQGRVVVGHQPLRYHGVPLAEGSDALSVVSASGKIHFRKRNLPLSFEPNRPTLSKGRALSLAEGAFRRLSHVDKVEKESPKLAYLTMRDSTARLVWSFVLSNGSAVRPVAYRYLVAARGDGEILKRRNMVYSSALAVISGPVWQATPNADPASMNLPYISAEVAHPKRGSERATASEKGGVAFSKISKGLLRSSLEGPLVRVSNHAGRDLVGETVLKQTNQGATQLKFEAGSDEEMAQVTSYYWSTRTIDFMKKIAPDLAFPKLTVNVNVEGSCNANWNYRTINFFKAGVMKRGGRKVRCPNTAYSSVIIHEIGHAVDQWHGGILEAGYSEGFADALSFLVLRDPCLGKGLMARDKCLRRADNGKKWPQPKKKIYDVGQVYTGFLWDLVAALERRYGSREKAFEVAGRLAIYTALGNPSDVPDAVRLALIIDDDDGDLSNGTPHHAEFALAAKGRNLPLPRMDAVGHSSGRTPPPSRPSAAKSQSRPAQSPPVERNPFDDDQSGGDPLREEAPMGDGGPLRGGGLGGSSLRGGGEESGSAGGWKSLNF